MDEDAKTTIISIILIFSLCFWIIFKEYKREKIQDPCISNLQPECLKNVEKKEK
jgi:hypothetical protein